VQVGSADATGLDGDLDLTCTKCFDFPFLDPEIAGSVNDDGFHGCTPRD
jgi:hypothetical protein